MAVAVISGSGQKLMPTTERHAARLLKKGKAVIYRYRPIFTIRLTERMSGKTQPVEYASDTGYQHVGISIKSEKHEYVHAQYDMTNVANTAVQEETAFVTDSQDLTIERQQNLKVGLHRLFSTV